jgi:hypothetical protein
LGWSIPVRASGEVFDRAEVSEVGFGPSRGGRRFAEGKAQLEGREDLVIHRGNEGDNPDRVKLGRVQRGGGMGWATERWSGLRWKQWPGGLEVQHGWGRAQADGEVGQV